MAENALDAGATRLHLEVEVSLGRLRLTDNGAGLTPDALAQAALPHTTSKIRALADLEAIQTLGFRGQALHSLAQLAHLEIHSRPAGGAQGWRAIYDAQGHCQALEPIPMAAGTVVVVEHLFAPWPQRQSVLPSPAQQVRQIQRVLEGLALCHPQVTWQVRGLSHTWALWPGTAAEVLAQVVPQTQGSLRQARVDMPAGTLELVLALPDYSHRPRPDRLWIAVNGRPVQVPELVESLLGGYGGRCLAVAFPLP